MLTAASGRDVIAITSVGGRRLGWSTTVPGDSHVLRRTAAMAMAALPRGVDIPCLHVWPHIAFLNQSASLGIGQHVLPLLAVTIVGPNSMIEGRWLPSDLISVACRSFKPTYRDGHTEGFRDDHDKVNVIGHGQ